MNIRHYRAHVKSASLKRTVPAGAIATAMAMVETLRGPAAGAVPQDLAARLAREVEHWGVATITEACSVIIGTAVALLRPQPDASAALHSLVPAALTRLQQIKVANPQADDLATVDLPTVAGILTASCLGQDAYTWRTSLGQIPAQEGLTWCTVAWLMVDMCDDLVLDGPGGFAGALTQVLHEMPSD